MSKFVLSSLLCLVMVEYWICVMWMNDSSPYWISICRMRQSCSLWVQYMNHILAINRVSFLLWDIFVENPMTCRYIKIIISHFPLIHIKCYCMYEQFSCRMSSWLMAVPFLEQAFYHDSSTMSHSVCSISCPFYCLALYNAVYISCINEHCSRC